MPADAMENIRNGTDHAASGGRLVSTDGRPFPLRSATLQASAAGGLARTILKQAFANPHREPLQVRERLFDATLRARRTEQALDARGPSSTAHGVLQRLWRL